MLNPHITQKIKEIFRQLEYSLPQVLFSPNITSDEMKKFRFFVADTGNRLPDTG